MKCTIRNAKTLAGASHNDRQFDLSKANHIDRNRLDQNIYYNIYDSKEMTFEEVELRYYKENYQDRLDKKNQSYIKNRHKENVKTMEQYMETKDGKPTEVILQIGGKNDNIDKDQFEICVNDYLDYMRQFENNIHMLDVAIHNDESTPHAHIRMVYDFLNEDGDREVGKDKALEALGYEAPDPAAPIDRHNNRLLTFSQECREQWMDICESHGFVIEREPNKEHTERLETKDYITQEIEKDLGRIKELENIILDLEETKIKYEKEAKEREKEREEREKEEQERQMQMQNKLAAQLAELTAQVTSMEAERANIERKLLELKEREEREKERIKEEYSTRSQRHILGRKEVEKEKEEQIR